MLRRPKVANDVDEVAQVAPEPGELPDGESIPPRRSGLSAAVSPGRPSPGIHSTRPTAR
jgi:hypothetical protein